MRRQWPIALALAIYWIATGILIVASTRQTGGRLVYPLDDTYVHMAIAKHVARHHVWGVTPYGFTSSTSSPLWTLLLSLTYLVFGAGVLAPLAFNLAAGTAIVIAIGRVMAARSAGPLLTLSVALIAIFATPLPTLTLIGMEHTVHALMTIWFAFTAAAMLASNRPAVKNSTIALAVSAALTTGFRYEGIFAVAVVALLFALIPRWREAGIAAGAGALPIVAYGLWSAGHGWYFLPNSVLLKGQTPARGFKAIVAFVTGWPAARALLANPHIFFLVLAALVLLLIATTAAVWGEEVFLLAILSGSALLHMQLARAGWFYRYEAYLVVLGVTIFGAIAADRLPPLREWRRSPAAWPRSIAVVVLIAVAGFPFVSRGLNAFRDTPTAASNIYSQQYQMGLFVDRFYAGQSVALNDIGATGFLADAKLLDIYGLASLDIARMKRTGRLVSQDIADLAAREGTVIAMVYPTWLNEYGGVPWGWIKVGEWGVRDNVVLGENAVSFYAVKPAARSPLIENLRQFASSLPPGVIQTGEYAR